MPRCVLVGFLPVQHKNWRHANPSTSLVGSAPDPVVRRHERRLASVTGTALERASTQQRPRHGSKKGRVPGMPSAHTTLRACFSRPGGRGGAWAQGRGTGRLLPSCRRMPPRATRMPCTAPLLTKYAPPGRTCCLSRMPPSSNTPGLSLQIHAWVVHGTRARGASCRPREGHQDGRESSGRRRRCGDANHGRGACPRFVAKSRTHDQSPASLWYTVQVSIAVWTLCRFQLRCGHCAGFVALWTLCRFRLRSGGLWTDLWRAH